jgi:GT2 family glycosyltransferase
VAVIVLTVNQRENTLRLLQSFAEPDHLGIRILIWDNGSTDGTCSAVRAQFGEVDAHWHPTNLGVASGRNAAARMAIERYRPTFLLFLDNDMVLRPGFVHALAAPFAGTPVLGQTQAKLLFLREPHLINDGGGCRINFWLGRTMPAHFREPDRGQCDAPAPCVACGGAMMVRTGIFDQLGGFDTVFDPFGPEDLDFSLRLQKRGWQSLYVPSAVAYHEVSHTFEGGSYSTTYARSKARHWLRFMRRHASPMQKMGFALVGAPLIAARMALREGRRGNPGAIVGSIRGLFESLKDPPKGSEPSAQRPRS